MRLVNRVDKSDKSADFLRSRAWTDSEKMVTGRIRKWHQEIVLMEQDEDHDEEEEFKTSNLGCRV